MLEKFISLRLRRRVEQTCDFVDSTNDGRQSPFASLLLRIAATANASLAVARRLAEVFQDALRDARFEDGAAPSRTPGGRRTPDAAMQIEELMAITARTRRRVRCGRHQRLDTPSTCAARICLCLPAPSTPTRSSANRLAPTCALRASTPGSPKRS
jgi:hypothetical protein